MTRRRLSRAERIRRLVRRTERWHLPLARRLPRALAATAWAVLGFALTAALACAFFALFSGCNGGYEQREPDSAREQEVVVTTAIRVWEARFGSVPECHKQHLTLGWASADDEAFDALCVGEMGWDGCCIVRQDSASTIILRDVVFEQSYLDWLRAHEVSHWLSHCSGLHFDGDPEHADERVFPKFVDEVLEEIGDDR